MIMKFLRGLAEAIAQPEDNSAQYSVDHSIQYHWSCECGAHSRADGFGFESDAQYAAQRHQWGKGRGHAMPAVHRTKTT